MTKLKDMTEEERKEYAHQAFKRWWEKNKDQKRAKNRAWKAANKNRVTNSKEYNQAYYKANKARLQAKKKAWYQANRDRILAEQRAARQETQANPS